VEGLRRVTVLWQSGPSHDPVYNAQLLSKIGIIRRGEPHSYQLVGSTTIGYHAVRLGSSKSCRSYAFPFADWINYNLAVSGIGARV